MRVFCEGIVKLQFEVEPLAKSSNLASKASFTILSLRVWVWVVLLLLTGCGHQQDVNKLLNTIPKEHRERIEHLFLQLCVNSSAAYTLFGPKPMSNEGYTDNIREMAPCELHLPSETLVFKQGWDSWARYQHLFPSQQYALKRIRFSGHPSYWHIFVINKPATLNILHRHIDTFNSILDTRLTAAKFWENMDSSDSFFQKVVENATLLGILLGYGKANAEAFTRRAEICFYMNRSSTPPFQLSHEWNRLNPTSRRFVQLYAANISPASLQPQPLHPSPGFDSLADELNSICSRASFFELEGCHHFLEYYGRPVFMTLENEPEADEWMKAYARTQKQLPQMLEGKPFLETVLAQWTR